jgi:hypothetical protein
MPPADSSAKDCIAAVCSTMGLTDLCPCYQVYETGQGLFFIFSSYGSFSAVKNAYVIISGWGWELLALHAQSCFA